MLTPEDAIAVIHKSPLSKRETLLVLLAIDPETPKTPAIIKVLGKKAGVKGISGWNPTAVLSDSKGQAVPNGAGWLLTGLGRNRVTDLAKSAGIDGKPEMPDVVTVKAASVVVGSAGVPTSGRVFIGHGRSPVWKDLRELLKDKLGVSCDEFNRVSTPGMTTVERLQQMLAESVFAFLVLTAEDEQKDGKVRARQNVIHEAGLFQGRHGFKRAIILLEDGCDDFSNVDGLTHISFPKGNVIAASEAIRDVLAREGVLPAT